MKGSHANIIRDLAAILNERLAVRFYHAPSSKALVKALKSLEIESKRKRAQSIFYRLRYRLIFTLDIAWPITAVNRSTTFEMSSMELVFPFQCSAKNYVLSSISVIQYVKQNDKQLVRFPGNQAVAEVWLCVSHGFWF